MIELAPDRMATAIGSAEPAPETEDGSRPERAVIDSREAGDGDLFFGLPGEQVDGGVFAEQALGQGAWGAVVGREHAAELARSRPGARVFAVDDPLAALQSLARAWRRALGCPTVGITGSTGKTSVKDITRAILPRRVHASPENFNTEIGLPLTILAAPPETEVLVLEMAMRGMGQIAELCEIAPRVLPYAGSAWRLLSAARRDGKRILFEGAQGALLDVDHGTYPFVTSSNTVAGQAAAGSGLGPGAVGYVLGITKAYTTRVGEGPFPTEDTGEAGEFLGRRGHEFGTVTGRKRRCGWFDAVLVRQTVQTSGIDGIALTKLDVLDGLETIKIAVGYRLDGKAIDHLPVSQGEQRRIEPVYETMEGWQDSTAGARTWNDLPAQAVKYVRHLEELIGAPVALLSTSPEREDTILVHDPFQS